MPHPCDCFRCVNECPACKVNPCNLCGDCESHFLAIADSIEAGLMSEAFSRED